MSRAQIEETVRVGELREQVVAELLAARWRCDAKKMGRYTPFDHYLLRENAPQALVEIRTLDRAHDQFPHFFIDLDKWFVLMLGEIGLNRSVFHADGREDGRLRAVAALPGLYVIAFRDGIWYVRIGTLPVNTYRLVYTGRTDRPEAKNDLSPVVRVPTPTLKRVCDADAVWAVTG